VGRSADVPRVSGQTDGDDRGCDILHVDMDAFFASVEVRRRPELRNRPVIVGGSQRGVVAAASYPARRYGVRSAMPMAQALRLCPQAVVLPPNRAAYSEASAAVMSILRTFTPLVQPLSFDEAFLDVSGARRVHGRPALVAAQIRRRVADELELTCSVGVAGTKFIAKLASARCKPDGLLVVPVAETLRFLHPLPVTVLWGVGARTAEPLRRLGVRTVGELADTPLATLRRALGNASAEHLSALAHGIDPRPVETGDAEKSVSADHTHEVDLTDEAAVREQLLRLADEVGARLRHRGLVAHTIGIKIRFADFRTVTRVRTLPGWTDATTTVYETAAALYAGLQLDRPRVRLVGVKAENLRVAADAPEQLTLEGTGPDQVHCESNRLDPVLDAARSRFGSAALGPATLLGQSTRESRSVRR
jgi:DNA polymerase-4